LQEEIARSRENSPPHSDFEEHTYLQCELSFNLDGWGKVMNKSLIHTSKKRDVWKIEEHREF
jgi:hypothetical protein